MPDPLVYPSRGAALIPLSKCLGAKFGGLKPQHTLYNGIEYVVVKYNINLCRELARIGVRITGPIRFHYHWPGKYIPYNHQMITSDFLTQHRRAFCFNEIGTGKTLSALWAADYLMNLGLINKFIVTSTLSTLDRVWATEIAHSICHRTSSVIHGTPKKREKMLAEDVDFYITNHDSLRSLTDQLAERPDIDFIIVDEGAVFRNQKATTLWVPCDEIINGPIERGCWWMTGSPMPKAPTDLYAQAKIVNAGTVPRYFSHFRDKTMFQVSDWKYVPINGWEKIAFSAIQPAIRFTRDELDLPPCIVPPPEMVEMSSEQSRAYKSFQQHFIAEFQGRVVSAVNEAALRTKLLQIAGGAIYHEDRSFTVLDVRPKETALGNWIEKSGYKLIIFVPYTHELTVVGDYLKKAWPDLTMEKLWGKSGKSRRNRVFADFQDGDLNIILSHPEIMAHGLTFTAATVIVWWSALDDYEIYDQANGRITRISQHSTAYIIRLACCKKEAEVYRRCEVKESMQGLLLDMIDN